MCQPFQPIVYVLIVTFFFLKVILCIKMTEFGWVSRVCGPSTCEYHMDERKLILTWQFGSTPAGVPFQWRQVYKHVFQVKRFYDITLMGRFRTIAQHALFTLFPQTYDVLLFSHTWRRSAIIHKLISRACNLFNLKIFPLLHVPHLYNRMLRRIFIFVSPRSFCLFAASCVSSKFDRLKFLENLLQIRRKRI